MKVSFRQNLISNPYVMNRKPVAVEQPVVQKKTEGQKKLDLLSFKTVMAVLTCFSVVLGINMLYFSAKRTFKNNKRLKFENSLVQDARAKQRTIAENRVPAVAIEHPIVKPKKFDPKIALAKNLEELKKLDAAASA